jgi:hypothetical protein
MVKKLLISCINIDNFFFAKKIKKTTVRVIFNHLEINFGKLAFLDKKIRFQN